MTAAPLACVEFVEDSTSAENRRRFEDQLAVSSRGSDLGDTAGREDDTDDNDEDGGRRGEQVGDGDQPAWTVSRTALEETTGPHEEETSAGEHAGHAEAVRDDEHEPEPGSAQ